jgi:valyl-tRNA synthetase
MAKTKAEVPEDAVSAIVYGAELFLPLEDLIDFEKEKERLEKECKKLEDEVKRVKSKLANQGFVAKAPAALIDAEREKEVKFTEMLEQVRVRLTAVEAKLKG